jgi:hypothetical protein
MEPNSEQLAAHIAATRDELSDNLDELGQRMKNAVNWRTQYEKHTALFLGAAVVGGVLLSRFGGSRSPRDDGRKSRPHAARPARTMRPLAPSVAGNFWSDVKAAAGSALGSQVYSVLRDVVPRVAERAGERLRARVYAGSRTDYGTDRRTAAPEGGD